MIPNNQDRIADAVGRFIADNFLKARTGRRAGEGQGPVRDAGEMAGGPERSPAALAGGLVQAVPALLDALDDETVSAFLRQQAADGGGGREVAPAFGSVLEALAEQGPPPGDPRCAAEAGLSSARGATRT